MTRLTISIEIEDYLYDLSEAHMETSILVHDTLLKELREIGEVTTCRILISSDSPKALEAT